jgi:hypothetical protein
MVLNSDFWKTVDRDEASISFFSQCNVSVIPDNLNIWFDFAKSTLDLDLYLGDRHLDMSAVIDPVSLTSALEGYRFILDYKLSTPENLIWQDEASCGGWNQNWVILCSSNADPIIGDISQSCIPVLQAWHGAGIWAPEPLLDSVTDLIKEISIEQKPEISIKSILRYTVIVTNFGITPKQVLLALKKMPEFAALSSQDLLKFQAQLPLTLLKDHVSKTVVDRVSKKLRSYGATIEIITDEFCRDLSR